MNLAVEEIAASEPREGRGTIVAVGLLCLVLIAAIWTFTLKQIRFERNQVAEYEFNKNSNLAIALEEHTNNVLKSAERTLRLIGHEYVRKGARLNIQEMIDDGVIDTNILSFAGVMDEHARRVLGSAEFNPIDVADQEYYQFHQRHDTADLHIGKPTPGRMPNTWEVPLSRRINKPDGSFGGVVYASLDPANFTRWFKRLNVGDDGVAMLVGLDGITRAERAGQTSSAGQNIRDSSLFAEQAKHAVGNYISADRFQHAPRLISYRTLTQHSLIVAVGTSQGESLASVHAQERNYYASAALTSGFILLYCAGLIFVLYTRKRGSEAVYSSNARYGVAFNQAAVGIARASLGGRLLEVNGKLCSMLGYSREELLARTYLDITHPDDREISTENTNRLVAGRVGSELPLLETRCVRKDGSPVWVTVAVAIVRNTGGTPDYFMAVIQDITDRKRAEHAMLRVNCALRVLGICNNVLLRAETEMQLLQRMCDKIVGVGDYLRTWVGIVEHDEQKTVRPIAYAGYAPGFIEQAQVTWTDNEHGRGPAGKAVRTRKLQVVQNAHTDLAFRLWQANAARLGYGSVLALPLISLNGVLGVLIIYSSEVDAFNASEMQLLNEVANEIAYGMVALRTRVAHETSEKRLLRNLEGTTLAMAATLDRRDAHTAGHQRHVAELAVAIAREVGMPEDEIHGLHLAAVMRDLGTIQIPAEILSKPTRLTPIEYDLIKTHAATGYDILKEVDFPWPVAQMVYQHHERLDGSGYPRGLKGAEILPGAKILAVADTVEAMASRRPYRPGFDIEETLEEVMSAQDTIYDRAAVGACVKLFREKQFAFSH